MSLCFRDFEKRSEILHLRPALELASEEEHLLWLFDKYFGMYQMGKAT